MGLESKHAIHLYPISHGIYSVGLPSTVWASMWSAPLVDGGVSAQMFQIVQHLGLQIGETQLVLFLFIIS